MSTLNPAFSHAIQGAQSSLIRHGASAANAASQAYGVVMNSILRQASVLAYIDCFYILAVVFGMMVPLVFMMRKVKAGGVSMGH
jgi:DHA2 family multidrug resistance protein